MTTLIFPMTTKQTALKEIIEKFKALKPFNFNLLILCDKKHKIVSEFEDLKENVDKKFEETQVEMVAENFKSQTNKKKKQEKINISLNIFPNGTKEESMINWAIKELPKCDLLLIRNDVKDFNINLIERLLSEGEAGMDIVMAKKPKKTNKIVQFFSDLAKKICSQIFHFNFYSGDIGVQFFSSFVHSVMKETNPLLLSKLNKWIAIKIKYIDFEIETTQIKQKSYGKNKLMLGVFSVGFILTIAFIFFLSSLSNISFVFYFLVAFFSLVFAILTMVTAFRIYFTYKFGDIHAEIARVVLRREIWITLKNLQKI